MIKNSKRAGFTLIEMLIVVAIIGILASIILVGLGPFQRQSRDAKRISELRQIQNGLELYFSRNGTYPVATAIDRSAWTNFGNILISAGIGIYSIPNDPSTNRSYRYASDSDGTTYVLGAVLEDSGNQALNQDIDGAVLGIDCGDATPIYCIRL